MYNYSNLVYENCIYTGTTFALFEYSVALKAATGNYLGLLYNYTDEENHLLLKLDASPLDASLISLTGGDETILATGTYTGGGPDTWITARVLNNGETTSVFINDALVFDSIPTPDHRYGYIGLHSRVNYLWVEEVGVEADTTMLPSVEALPVEQPESRISIPIPSPGSASRYAQGGRNCPWNWRSGTRREENAMVQ